MVLDPRPPDEEDDILEDARTCDRLLRAARLDELAVAIVNRLCPHWPPLPGRSRSSLDSKVEDIVAVHNRANKKVNPDDIHRSVFGLDP